MAIKRRRLIIGAGAAGLAATGLGAAILVDRGILPGQSTLDRALGRCDVSVPPAGAAPGPVVRGEFDSTRRRRSVPYLIAYPPSTRPGDPLPVCLVLHGYGAAASDAIDAGQYDRHLATLTNAGSVPFALAAMDGGDGYWHPHATDDPLGALLDEFLPLLASRGLEVGQVAVLGWSMGGYGALLCGISRPDRCVAVVASGPAFWRSYHEARRVNAGAFDSAQEWTRYDLLSRAAQFRGLRMRIDCAVDDPFAPVVRELRDRLPDHSVVHLAKGCHDSNFWQYAAPAQLRMIGDALAASTAAGTAR